MSRRSVVLTLLLTLMSGAVMAVPVAADTSPKAVTWSFTNANTISAVGRIEIYPLCPRCTGAVDEKFAAKVKAQIERVWRQSRPTYKCADLVVTADVKVGTDASHVDPDRVAVAIDNTVIDDRSLVVSEFIEESKWNSNAPADKVVPVNSDDPDNSTTWIWSNSLRPDNSIYAHEFGHVLGLADGYHVIGVTATGDPLYGPYPDAGVDVMSVPRTGLLEQSTIDRLVERHGDLLDLSKLPGCSSPPPTVSPSCRKGSIWLTRPLVGAQLAEVSVCAGASSIPNPVELEGTITGDQTNGLYHGTVTAHVKVRAPLGLDSYFAQDGGTITWSGAWSPNPNNADDCYGSGTADGALGSEFTDGPAGTGGVSSGAPSAYGNFTINDGPVGTPGGPATHGTELVITIEVSSSINGTCPAGIMPILTIGVFPCAPFVLAKTGPGAYSGKCHYDKGGFKVDWTGDVHQ